MLNINKLFLACCVVLFSLVSGIENNLTAANALDIVEFTNGFSLSQAEKNSLQQGKVVLKGQKGKYLGQVVTKGDLETAWQVLTDYNNFQNFLPNIASSKIISNSANKVVFEQINVVDLWLLKQEFKVKIAADKNKPNNQITFQIIDGDLKKLRGAWTIETTPTGQVLVKHLVEVEPGSNTEKPFFYGVYESSLEDTLQAIAQEISRRDQQANLN